MSKIPSIALVGNAPADKRAVLNGILSDEELGDLCDIRLYGADGQTEDEALKDALDDYADGYVDGVVCLPTEQPLEQLLRKAQDKATEIITIITGRRLRLAPFDTKADKDAARRQATDKAKRVAEALKWDFNVLNPRVAVLSSSIDKTQKNSGDHTSTAAKTGKVNTQVFGPYAAREFWREGKAAAFDAIVAEPDQESMSGFRDICGEPLLTLCSGVDAPVVQAEAESVLSAAFLAITVGANRERYDEPFANPLPKLYRERKEDSDRARHTVKKKDNKQAGHNGGPQDTPKTEA